MDYEKKYKEALEWLRNGLYPATRDEMKEQMEKHFPELKESEDEKIRKDIVEAVELHKDFTQERKELIFTWLEKQGKQKPVEEKVWSIYNAKDGDVLNSERVQATIIFKGFADDGKHIIAYCALQKGIFISQELLWDRDFEPASEFWKNALYDAMTKKGYEWDADNLYLKKSVEWSEEDEQFLLVCKNALSKYQVSDKWDAGIISQWLENRLKTHHSQKQWKPSDNELEVLRLAAEKDGTCLMSLYEQLKKL